MGGHDTSDGHSIGLDRVVDQVVDRAGRIDEHALAGCPIADGVHEVTISDATGHRRRIRPDSRCGSTDSRQATCGHGIDGGPYAAHVGARLEHLTAGEPMIFGGDRVTTVPETLAAALVSGDQLLVVQETGNLLHIPSSAQATATDAVTPAASAFGALSRCTDEQITEFFERFAQRLADDTTGAPILEANARDVASAKAAGRSTTRLILTDKMRADMVAGLRSWAESPLRRDEPVQLIEHDASSVEARRAPLGIVDSSSKDGPTSSPMLPACCARAIRS